MFANIYIKYLGDIPIVNLSLSFIERHHSNYLLFLLVLK